MPENRIKTKKAKTDRSRGSALAATTVLKLKDQRPVAKGNMRLVFEHPDDPSLLVKVVRPDVIDVRFGEAAPWYKRGRRWGTLRSFAREIDEFIALYAVCDTVPPFLPKTVGLAETDLGLGIVTTAARDEDGSLAPNLADLIKSGRFDSTVLRNLQNFFRQILESNVVISDMNVGNLVYAYDNRYGRRFVLIDGLGNSNLVPLKRFSRAINRRSKCRRFQRLLNRITQRLERAGYPNPPLPRAEG